MRNPSRLLVLPLSLAPVAVPLRRLGPVPVVLLMEMTVVGLQVRFRTSNH